MGVLISSGDLFQIFLVSNHGIQPDDCKSFCAPIPLIYEKSSYNTQEKWVSQHLPENMFYARCFALDNAIIIAGSLGDKRGYILEKGKWETFIEKTRGFSLTLVDNSLVYAFQEDEICTLKVIGDDNMAHIY